VIINAILENNNYFGDGLRVWNDLKKRFPEFARLLGTCIPGDKKISGLQTADALATGAYRLEKAGNLDLKRSSSRHGDPRRSSAAQNAASARYPMSGHARAATRTQRRLSGS
jgi:hypothetical protein